MTAVLPVPAHFAEEARFKPIGTTDDGPHVCLVFTQRVAGGDTYSNGPLY